MVLVADESPVIRNMFHSFPNSEIQVRAVVPGRHELTQAMSDFVVLDAVLCAEHLSGQYGGVHALHELRANDKLPNHTSFILMSADARKSNLMVSIEAQPDGILLKPFSPATLIQKLDTTVTARRALAELRHLSDEKHWAELLRVASTMLDTGTQYKTAATRFKLEALSHLGQHDAVLSMYQSMHAAAPKSTSILEALARHAYQHGYLAEAETALRSLLALQPANLAAADLLIEVYLAQGDSIAAQQQLQLCIRQSPNNVQRHRVLGHIALLNADTFTAQHSYLLAMRQHGDENGLLEEDAINAVRALLLHGDTPGACKVLGEARAQLQDNHALYILDRLAEALLYNGYESFGRTHRRLAEGLSLLERAILPQSGALTLAAVEACLIALLPHRAFKLVTELLNSPRFAKLHSSQQHWARKLNRWIESVDSEELPKALLNYKKYIG